MVKIVTINRLTEKDEIKVYFDKIGDTWQIKTEPYNMVIEDSVGEMLDDIDVWDFDYLREIIGYVVTNVATGL